MCLEVCDDFFSLILLASNDAFMVVLKCLILSLVLTGQYLILAHDQLCSLHLLSHNHSHFVVQEFFLISEVECLLVNSFKFFEDTSLCKVELIQGFNLLGILQLGVCKDFVKTNHQLTKNIAKVVLGYLRLIGS